jgi:actin-like protein 6A
MMDMGDDDEDNSSSSSSSKSKTADGNKKIYYAGDTQTFRRDHMEIARAVNRAVPHDWDAIEAIYEHAFTNRLSLNSQHHPIMLPEAFYDTPETRARHSEILFEKFGVPAVYFCKSAVLNAFALGKSTALVVDVGATHTDVVPVHDGYILHSAAQTHAFGGDNLDQLIRQALFTDTKIDLPAQYQYQRSIVEGKLVTKRLSFPDTTASYELAMQTRVLLDLKHTHCHVSETSFDFQANANIPFVNYELPDGNVINIGATRFSTVEHLFVPASAKKESTQKKQAAAAAAAASSSSKMTDETKETEEEQASSSSSDEFLGVHEMAIKAVGACDVDLRKDLFGSVVLAGGVTLLPGFSSRLINELSKDLAPSLKVKIVPCSTNEQRCSAWIGGSILASLGSFNQLWFYKAEYLEFGASKLASKCPVRVLVFAFCFLHLCRVSSCSLSVSSLFLIFCNLLAVCSSSNTKHTIQPAVSYCTLLLYIL